MSLFYSTSPSVNNLFSDKLRIPIVKSAEFDDNNDGKTDRFEISMAMPTNANEKISSVSAAIYQDVQISNMARYIFDAMSYVNYESAIPFSKLTIDGDLNIWQSWPFSAKGG